MRWRSATAADRDLLQAPFRAGIRLDAYQLLPLRKALRLPRVNLLIADDVGLGKTVEAGLGRARASAAAANRFHRRHRTAIDDDRNGRTSSKANSVYRLTLSIVSASANLRRLHGFSVNPWTTGSRFIISHSLLTEENYVAGLRDVLGEFRSRALLIVDEAHHAAPSSGARYAISSQLTRAVRELAERFEHRLFLTATPHNGHSNSFSALLEMLDPQRFTRGVEVRPRDLEPVVVRRLKADLRRIGEAFPERRIEPIAIAGLPRRRRSSIFGAGLPHTATCARADLPTAAAEGGTREARLRRIAAAATVVDRRLCAHLEGTSEEPYAADRGGAGAGHCRGRADIRDGSTTDELKTSIRRRASRSHHCRGRGRGGRSSIRRRCRRHPVADLRSELAAVDEMLHCAKQHAARPDTRVLGWWTGSAPTCFRQPME